MTKRGSQMALMLPDMPGHDVPPGLSRRDGTGQGYMNIYPVPVPAPVPADPAARWRNRKERRAAWEQWSDGGGDLDALPPGLVSATLDAAMRRDGAPAPKWRKR